MEQFRLLITDLTDYGTLRCVAGWDLDRQKMVRPEPHPGGFWEQTLCGEGKPFAPGHIVILEASPPQPKTELPHLNEDKVVKGAIKLDKTLSRDKFLEMLRNVAAVSRATSFAAPVEISNSKAFVRTGTDHPSLKGLLIKGNEVSFVEEKYGDKPARARALIDIPHKAPVNLSIAATDLREVFRKQNVAGLSKLFRGKDDLHVRLGLARGFGAFPDRCYMQINGIYRL